MYLNIKIHVKDYITDGEEENEYILLTVYLYHY